MKAAVAVIPMVVVVAVLLPMLIGNGLVEYPEWQYDDYRVVDDATAASGSLELVDVGGTTYVHAHDLGPGTITHSDGTSMDVTVQRAVLDVFLITGQSNAAYTDSVEGLVDPSAASPVPVPGTGYYFGTESRYDRLTSGDPTFRSMTASDGSAAIGDKAPSFASTYNSMTGHKVYWICGAVGSKAMDTFVPSSGYVWMYMLRIVPAAMEAVDDGLFVLNPKGYLWIQGEADYSTPVEEYKEEFLAMHSAILDGWLGTPFDHCFISSVVSGNAVTAQRELSDEVTTVTLSTEAASTFTQENGLMGPDGLHYSQLGDNVIGAALGSGCAQYYSQDQGGPFGDIISVIPLLIVLGVLAAAVAVLITRR